MLMLPSVPQRVNELQVYVQDSTQRGEGCACLNCLKDPMALNLEVPAVKEE